MLVALLQNNNNSQARPVALPTVKIDRGGGGPLWPRYDIMDIVAAASAFPEIVGEDSVARAVRRIRWIGEALPFVKEAREKREAAAFLAGAQVAERAVREEYAAAEMQTAEQPAREEYASPEVLARLVKIIDEVRAASLPVPRQRPVSQRGDVSSGADIGGVAVVVGLVLGGVLIGKALSRRKRH